MYIHITTCTKYVVRMTAEIMNRISCHTIFCKMYKPAIDDFLTRKSRGGRSAIVWQAVRLPICNS